MESICINVHLGTSCHQQFNQSERSFIITFEQTTSGSHRPWNGASRSLSLSHDFKCWHVEKNTELPICHFRREQLPPQRYKLSNDSSIWSIVKTLHELFIIYTEKDDKVMLTSWGHLRSLPFSVEQTIRIIFMNIQCIQNNFFITSG